jgi:1,2-phenylacetyl-CoA epoxidase PaaB subunit
VKHSLLYLVYVYKRMIKLLIYALQKIKKKKVKKKTQNTKEFFHYKDGKQYRIFIEKITVKFFKFLKLKKCNIEKEVEVIIH